MVALPYYLLVEAPAPLLEALGYVLLATGLATGAYGLHAVAIVVAAYGFGAAATVMVLLFDEIALHEYRGLRDRSRIAMYCIVEQFVYRPMTIVWRLRGLTLWLRGRSDWGHMEGSVFDTAASAG